MNRDDGLRGLPHHRWADVVFEHVELVCHVDEVIDIASNGGHDNAHEILTQLRGDFQNHAVVEQNDSSVRPDQKVARMRIGVKEATDEKLIAVELDEVLDHAVRIDVVADDFVHFRHAKAFEELHHENARGRDFAVNLRNDHEFAFAIELAETFEVVRLVQEVHLFRNDARKFLDDRAGRPDDVVIDELLEHEHQVLDDAHIGSHEFFNTGPQDLHDHVFAAIAGAVHLSERRGSERFFRKGIEDGFRRLPQLRLNALADILNSPTK